MISERSKKDAILLTEKQLAERWKLPSAKKLQADRLKRIGCPYIKLGKLVRYHLDDVEAYEASHRVVTVNQNDSSCGI